MIFPKTLEIVEKLMIDSFWYIDKNTKYTKGMSFQSSLRCYVTGSISSENAGPIAKTVLEPG